MTLKYEAYERFLRFDELSSSVDLLRARTVYIVGWAFIFTQCLNIASMSISYGGWVTDHVIALISMFTIFIVVHCLRYTKNFVLFTVFYNVMLVIGVYATAIQFSIGINSSLLPLLVFVCILSGFVGGPRMAVFSGFVCIVFVWILYEISFNAAPEDAIALEFFETRTMQRAIQATLTVILGTVFSFLLSTSVNQLIERFEQNAKNDAALLAERSEMLLRLTKDYRMSLSGMMALTQNLIRTTQIPEHRKPLQKIENCGRRMIHTTSLATDISQLDSHTFVLNIASFNLKTSLSRMVEMLNPVATLKGLHLNMTFASQLPECFLGDRARIEKCLRNIIVHALRTTPTGSVHVYVDGRVKGADKVQLRVSIVDTSDGLTPKQVAAVFSRIDKTSFDPECQKSGLNLELALSAEILEKMGGTVTAESALGSGTRFEIAITLPVASEPLKDSPSESDFNDLVVRAGLS